MVAPLGGFFQSLVPVARPMKLFTVMGALSGKSVQLMLPAVVSKIACTGCDAAGVAGFVAAGLAVEGFGGALPVCAAANPAMISTRITFTNLCMIPPNVEFISGATKCGSL